MPWIGQAERDQEDDQALADAEVQDRGLGRAVLVGDRIHEQRPAVLQIRDHRHADDAHEQLHPAVRRRARRDLVQRAGVGFNRHRLLQESAGSLPRCLRVRDYGLHFGLPRTAVVATAFLPSGFMWDAARGSDIRRPRPSAKVEVFYLWHKLMLMDLSVTTGE